MKHRFIGGELRGVRWRWHSKPRRLLHRLAVRLGIIEPPVHRVSVMAEAMAEMADDYNRRLLDLVRQPPRFKELATGKRVEWRVEDADYSPAWNAAEAGQSRTVAAILDFPLSRRVNR